MQILIEMLDLKQAGKIANNRLKLDLAKFCYAPVARNPSVYKHARNNITFALVIKYFGIRYVGKQHDEHLIQVLQQLYNISINWAYTLFCGITITWNYKNRNCKIYMPHYLQESLHTFQHPSP